AGSHAAVSHEHRARAIGALVAGEEQGKPRDFVVGSVALQGDERLESTFDRYRITWIRLLLDGPHHTVFDGSGVDGVDPDVLGSQLERGALRQAYQSVLAGDVGPKPACPHKSCYRRGKHDASTTSLRDLGRRVLDTEPGSPDVHGEHSVEFLRGSLGQRAN